MKSANEAAKQAAIASRKVVSARKAERLAKKAAERVKKIIKGIIDAVRRLVGALAAASLPLLLILILAGAIAALVASAFGIFFGSSDSSDNTRTLQSVVLSINKEFNDSIDDIESSVAHDEVTIEGSQAPWPEVLSIYAVYVTTREDGAMDVVHITDDHITILKDIFWAMNTVSHTTEQVSETTQVPLIDENGEQQIDENGNPMYTDQTTVKTILHITISHLTAAEEAANLSFTEKQMAELAELLDEKNASLWGQILIGVGSGSDQLVNVALSQLGNKGGEKFWRWAGRTNRCAWCALFVSWCADQTGLLSSGQIPYFSFVQDGVSWFKNKGKWIDGSDVNGSNCEQLIQPGMIIFFDWEPDGKPNHVGIVTSVSGGKIKTVEGNKSDVVAEGSYSADSVKLFGFGVVG